MSVTGDSDPMATAVAGSVFTPRQVRILKIAVILMGILLVGGFAFVLAAIVYQASRSAQDNKTALTAVETGQGMVTLELPIPREASVSGLALDGDRMAVTLGGDKPEIVVIDLGSGAVVARVRLKPQQ